jgi:hypothetical protein
MIPTPLLERAGGRARSLAMLVLCMALTAMSACAAVNRTPPLSRPDATGKPRFSSIYLTSGTFSRPHHAAGVVQMTLEDYRWLHEKEVVDDPNDLLYKVAALAREHGAHGIQHLELIDRKPQTRAEKISKQIDTAIRVFEQVEEGDAPTALGEGTKTRYFVKGELVIFDDEPGEK